MSDTIHVTLRGRIGTDLRTYSNQSGIQNVRFRMAVPQWRIKDNGDFEELEARWYTIRAWGRLAEHALASVRKGNPVIVIGRPGASAWKDDAGEVSSELVITAQTLGPDLNYGIAHYQKFHSTQDGLSSKRYGDAFDGQELEQVHSPHRTNRDSQNLKNSSKSIPSEQKESDALNGQVSSEQVVEEAVDVGMPF